MCFICRGAWAAAFAGQEPLLYSNCWAAITQTSLHIGSLGTFGAHPDASFLRPCGKGCCFLMHDCLDNCFLGGEVSVQRFDTKGSFGGLGAPGLYGKAWWEVEPPW